MSLAVAIILAAQTVALAHTHDATRRFVPQTRSVGSVDICELCVLAFHTPLNPVQKAILERPSLEVLTALVVEPYVRNSGPYAYCLTRAPPFVS